MGSLSVMSRRKRPLCSASSRACLAEQRLGGAIDRLDVSVMVEADDGIGRMVDDGLHVQAVSASFCSARSRRTCWRDMAAAASISTSVTVASKATSHSVLARQSARASVRETPIDTTSVAALAMHKAADGQHPLPTGAFLVAADGELARAGFEQLREPRRQDCRQRHGCVGGRRQRAALRVHQHKGAYQAVGTQHAPQAALQLGVAAALRRGNALHGGMRLGCSRRWPSAVLSAVLSTFVQTPTHSDSALWRSCSQAENSSSGMGLAMK